MLENLKLFLGIEPADLSKDTLLKLIIANATARLKVLLGNIEPPLSLEHIILEVAIIRFNRIGSEGASSHSVDGESLSFAADDFEQFKDEIQAYLNSQSDSSRGKVRFI